MADKCDQTVTWRPITLAICNDLWKIRTNTWSSDNETLKNSDPQTWFPNANSKLYLFIKVQTPCPPAKVITHIYLSNNNIERMPSYEYILTSQFSMTRLRELWLMNNNIRRLELSKIHHLRSSLRLLSAANNKIATVEPPNEPFSRLRPSLNKLKITQHFF